MKRLLKIGAVIGCLLIVCAVFIFNLHLQRESELEAFRKQLIAAGEKLTLQEVTPPSLPSESNSAHLVAAIGVRGHYDPEGVLSLNPPSSMRSAAPGKAIIAWKQPDIASSERTNEWSELEAELLGERERIGLAHSILDKPGLDFHLEYSRHGGPLMAHLAPLKGLTQLLSAATAFDLRNGDTEAALKHVRTTLTLAKGLRHDRLAISELVRIAMTSIAFGDTWELLQSDLSDEQLAALQEAWSDLEFIEGYEDSIVLERAFMASGLRSLRRGQNWSMWIGTSVGSDWFEDAKRRASAYAWRAWWSHDSELRMLKAQQVMIESARAVRTNYAFGPAEVDQATKLAAPDITVTNDWGMLEKVLDTDFINMLMESWQGLSRMIHRVAMAESMRQMALTAVALKRYHHHYGEYPAELSALVPAFLPVQPLDPMDGRPLRYRPRDDGTFLLYSIGTDGVDDGGDPTSTRRRPDVRTGKDLVWPEPATAEEIETFLTNSSSHLP